MVDTTVPWLDPIPPIGRQGTQNDIENDVDDNKAVVIAIDNMMMGMPFSATMTTTILLATAPENVTISSAKTTYLPLRTTVTTGEITAVTMSSTMMGSKGGRNDFGLAPSLKTSR